MSNGPYGQSRGGRGGSGYSSTPSTNDDAGQPGRYRKTDAGWQRWDPETGSWVKAHSYSTSGGPLSKALGLPGTTSYGRDMRMAGEKSIKEMEDRMNRRSKPYLDQYRQMLFQSLQQPLGADYQAGTYYKSLMRGLNKLNQRYGWKVGNRHAASGSLSGPSAGAGQAAQHQREANIRDAYIAADAQARQQKVAEDRAYIQQLVAGIGGETELMSDEFNREWQKIAAMHGLTQAEAQSELDQLRMWLELTGSVLDLGVTAATAGAGGPPLMPGWNQQPIYAPNSGLPGR